MVILVQWLRFDAEWLNQNSISSNSVFLHRECSVGSGAMCSSLAVPVEGPKAWHVELVSSTAS